MTDRPRQARAIALPPAWSTLEAFVADDPRRGVWAAGGRHSFVAVVPARGSRTDRWVVRWIPATGEVYAAHVHNPPARSLATVDRVLLLGAAPTEDLLRAAVAEPGGRSSVSAIRARLVAAQPSFARWSERGLEQLLAA